MASTMTRSTLMVATLLAAGVGCGESDDSTEPADESAATTAAPPATEAPSSQPSTTTPPDTGPVETAPPDETTPRPTEPQSSEPVGTVPAASGAGTAVVDVGGDRYEFRVTQCLRDRPSVFGDTIIDMTLDGVPVGTPQELIDSLLGEMDPDTDLIPLVEPVAEYGPLLTVSRFDGGGDYVVVYDLDTIEILSDPDPLSPDSRFLEVPDGDVGITISGATTADGAALTLTATCP